MPLYPPNILITNYCNQNCPFCFAKREMGSTTLDREISLDAYMTMLTKIRNSGYKSGVVKLLGGEPTLHSKLFNMIDVTLQNNLTLQIFTNGIMGKEKMLKLSTYRKKIGYTFNIMTPGFLTNLNLRSEVISNMKELGKKSNITLSVTIDPYFKPASFIDLVSKDMLQVASSIRIGLGNPIAGERNWYTFAQFPKIGQILSEFISQTRALGFTGIYSLNCGFTRCMFTEEQHTLLRKEVQFTGWSCLGKESSMDVAVDLTAFHCFPLSRHKRIDLKKKSYKKADHELMKERMRLWAKLKMKVCITCPFYGYGGDMCPGPCLAFRMNL